VDPQDGSFQVIWEQTGSAEDRQNLNYLTNPINQAVRRNYQFT